MLPVLFEGQVKAVIELASFNRFSEIHLAFLDQLVESMGIVLNTIEATMRTEQLLKQSQALTEELQSQQQELTEGNQRLEAQAHTLQASEELLRQQQEELQRTNLELQEKARQLAEQNAEVERKNREVEQAKQALEDKAEQLALISKYKSRVPGEHVARAADAAEQPADPGQGAGRERGGQAVAEAGEVRGDHLLRGQRICSR